MSFRSSAASVPGLFARQSSPMNDSDTGRICGFDAIVIRSPMQLGGEAKDQDRAVWSKIMATACVCDGVTSSPSAAQAAEIASQFSRVLFKDESHLKNSLRTLADLLVVHRLESQQAPVQTAPDTPEAMQAMLQEVARENLARSFQTTLVSAAFVPMDDMVAASVVWIGDSAFFAFSADGDLLASSLPHKEKSDRNRDCGVDELSCHSRAIRFAVGDEVLAKILCDASERPGLAQRAGIRTGSAGNWLICAPLDQVGQRSFSKGLSTNESNDVNLWLEPNDLLLVPRYLAEMPRDPQYRNYCRIRRCQAVRALKNPSGRQVALQDRSSVTAVLPDHFYTGGWSFFRERFPRDGQFVLGSDGFYSCFSSPKELWRWLNANKANLRSERRRVAVLADLHRSLHHKASDDDISFVWIFEGLDSPASTENGGDHYAC